MYDIKNAVEVKNVKKYFKVYYDRGVTIKDKFLSKGSRSKYERREVLKGISFNIKKGEAIGLVGRNGCGKSTTLKLLTKIMYPNEGTVELNGRVSSLLELGAGFHPDMSGMENIYMNAAVFGLNRKEIDKRVKDIISFSELEKYIDNPVRTYSSGMYMRLAFSVAINVDADILLIDEILAVGDINFQKKCFEKLDEIKLKGTTIVIVSHSLDQIEKICDRSIWIEDGHIKEQGIPRQVHEKYLHDMETERFRNESCDDSTLEHNDVLIKIEEDEIDNQQRMLSIQNDNKSVVEIEDKISKLNINFLDTKRNIIHTGTKEVQFIDMFITSSLGEEKTVFETGDDIEIYLKYLTNEPNLKGTLCFLIYREDGLYCYGTNTFIEKQEIVEFDKYEFLKISLYDLPLLPGNYYISLGIHDEQANSYDNIDKVATIQIMSNKNEQGIVRINSEWCME